MFLNMRGILNIVLLYNGLVDTSRFQAEPGISLILYGSIVEDIGLGLGTQTGVVYLFIFSQSIFMPSCKY